MEADEEKNVTKQIVAFCNFLKAPKKRMAFYSRLAHLTQYRSILRRFYWIILKVLTSTRNDPPFFSHEGPLHIIPGLSRGNAVDIATRYELDGQGIESRWGRHFPHSSRAALGPALRPVQWVPGLSLPGVKYPGCGVNHLLPKSAKVKERLQL
jgi:hypothetical protein